MGAHTGTPWWLLDVDAVVSGRAPAWVHGLCVVELVSTELRPVDHDCPAPDAAAWATRVVRGLDESSWERRHLGPVGTRLGLHVDGLGNVLLYLPDAPLEDGCCPAPTSASLFYDVARTPVSRMPQCFVDLAADIDELDADGWTLESLCEGTDYTFSRSVGEHTTLHGGWPVRAARPHGSSDVAGAVDAHLVPRQRALRTLETEVRVLTAYPSDEAR